MGATSDEGGRDRSVRHGGGRLSDVLAEEIATMIAAGEFADGERLPPERALIERFHVSRTAVREAITTLASRGLLITKPGHRPVVSRPSYETALGQLGHFLEHLLEDSQGIWNLFDSRVFVEMGLVRHAALNARKEHLEELRLCLERNRQAIGDPEQFYATDVAFHGVLYRIPDNPIYPALHKAYVEWLWPHWKQMEPAPDLDRLHHRLHSRIYEAISARDPDRAEQALRRHLEIAWELVKGTFDGASEA